MAFLENIQQLGNRFILFCLMIMAFSFTLHYPAARLAALMALVLLPWFLHKAWTKPHIGQSETWVLAYVGFVTLALLWSKNPGTGFDQTLSALPWLLIPLIALWLKKSGEKTFFGIIFYALLAGGMVFTLWTLMIVYNLADPRSVGHSEASLRYFYNSSYLYVAHFAGLFSLLYLYLSLISFRRKLRLWGFVWLTAGLLSTILLFSLEGRGGQLAFMAGLLALVLWLAWSRGRMLALIAAILVVIFVAGLAYLSSDTLQRRVDNTRSDIQKIAQGDLHGSWGQRLAMWELGAEAWRQKPFFGYGTGASTAIGEILHRDKEELIRFIPKIWRGHLHNQYVETLKQHGMVGLFLMLGMFIALLRSAHPANHAIVSIVLIHLAIASLSNAMLLRYDVVFSVVILMALFIHKPFDGTLIKEDW